MSKVKCLECNRPLTVRGATKHLTSVFIPESFKTKKCRVLMFSCGWDDCKLQQYQLRWNQDNDPKQPQKLQTLDDAYWNQAQFERPNSQDVNPSETSHCKWTDDVSLTTGSNFQKILKRERRFAHFIDTQSEWATKEKRFRTAEENRQRIDKLLEPVKKQMRKEWRELTTP